MVQRIGGFRRKTRQKMTKSKSDKGRVSIREFLKTLEIGESVNLKLEPGYQKGMFHPRFHGKSGKVIGKEGNCYKIKIKDGGKEKLLIAHPIHVKRK